jgi:uncharacterized protein (TIGR02118 family)
MEHLLIALWRAPGADLAPVQDAWAPAALAVDNVQSCTISAAVADQGRFANGDPVDVLIALGLQQAHDLDDVPERGILYRVAREVNVWRVDPRRPIVSDDPTTITPVGIKPMGIKMVSLVARAPQLTHEQFVRHWTEVHAPLARRHHVGVAEYTQNVVRRAYTPGGAAVDGIAELRFRTREDFEHRFYDSDEGREIIRRDVQQFIARPSGHAALMHERLLRAG